MAAAAKELPACPVETTLTLISDKWKVLILRDLMPGTKRFGELKKSIGSVSGRCIPESTDRAASGYGRAGACMQKSLRGSSSSGGIQPDRTGVQPETHSGRHEELGRGV